LSKPKATSIGSNRARLVTGRATNEAGVRIRLRAITLQAPKRNYALVSFVSAEVDAGSVQPMVTEILRLFRPRA
jgi:hypothetical protein